MHVGLELTSSTKNSDVGHEKWSVF